ncbi:MAG TPA: hypothetical protein VLV49_04070 [Terriglobales bacterium]|nr:hypothetical protein [Terriglobales bacterium]
MSRRKMRPGPKIVPQTSEMARGQNTPSEQQRDDNQRADFVSQAAERVVGETPENQD